jgi:hypothetical protein
VEPGKRSHRLGWPSFGLSRSLRDNLAGPGVGQVEGAHAIDVGARKPADSGEGGLQVLAEAVDHCGAPAFGLLPFHDVLADVPVESKEFVVNGEGGLDLSVSDAFFQVAQEVGIAVRHRQRPASAWLIGWCTALLCHRCTDPLPGRCLPTVPVLPGLGKRRDRGSPSVLIRLLRRRGRENRAHSGLSSRRIVDEANIEADPVPGTPYSFFRS